MYLIKELRDIVITDVQVIVISYYNYCVEFNGKFVSMPDWLLNKPVNKIDIANNKLKIFI